MKYPYIGLIISLFVPIGSIAQNWEFSPATPVTQNNSKTFHHLESAGRRNIVVSSDIVGITWEDDRSGTASIYLALKNKQQNSFITELKISADKDAYEPSIIALSNKRFAISWEENEHVFVRVVSVENLKKPSLTTIFKLPVKPAMQASLTTQNNLLYVVFSEYFEHHHRIRLIQLNINPQQQLSLKENCLVDAQDVKEDQLYPTAVVVDQNIILGWEDRRLGHTVIMASQSQLQQIL